MRYVWLSRNFYFDAKIRTSSVARMAGSDWTVKVKRNQNQSVLLHLWGLYAYADSGTL